MSTLSQTKRCEGLTLAELVVLALIAGILGLLLFLKLTDGRERGGLHRAHCLSNLKQIGLAIAMYAQDNENRCPMDATTPTLVGSLRLLTNFVTAARVVHCPGDSRRQVRKMDDWAEVTAKNVGYSYVPNLIWKADTNAIVALDRIYATKAGSPWPSDGNHRGVGGNILFSDGRVAWHAKLPSALTDKDGREIVLSP
jgi:hypothetical protein